MDRSRRTPTFVVIGSMKSGTTTLHTWLEQQPDVVMAPKEPNFFSRDEVWNRGVGWYEELFGSDDAIARGDVSPSYTNPAWAGPAAQRMREVVPDARIVYLLRHPVERLRSHYLHQVRRARETRPLLDAIAEPNNPYVARSRYFACLQPFLRHFDSEQICVERLADLVEGEQPGWTRVLDHIGLPHRAPPGTHHYAGAEQPAHTRAFRWLSDRGHLHHVGRLPGPVRRVGRVLALRRGSGIPPRLEASATAELPPAVLETLGTDVAALERWLGRSLQWALDHGSDTSGPV